MGKILLTLPDDVHDVLRHVKIDKKMTKIEDVLVSMIREHHSDYFKEEQQIFDNNIE